MKNPVRFPLLAKVLGWLVLHLIILGLGFVLFVKWQLGLGLDSLLSGSAGERLGGFGDAVVARIAGLPPPQWNDEIEILAREKDLSASLIESRRAAEFPWPIPPNVIKRTRAVMPPRQSDPPPPRHPSRPPPSHQFDDPAGMSARTGESNPNNTPASAPRSKPVFLLRGDHGDGYWAGVLVHPPSMRERPPRHPMLLLVRSDRLDGSGMFFDYQPWLWGGLAVLMLSLAFWTPFVWGITRYLRRLTAAADRIAAGHFEISLPPGGNDELGNLGRSIETMAARLDQLVAGQKRFLGDAAHELCAPLARIRTGLGILEMKTAGMDPATLASIESDVAELASLVNEILAFSRAGNRALSLRETALEPLLRDVITREAANAEVAISIPAGLVVHTDPALLGRAIGNLVRNAAIHGGPQPKVEIQAAETAGGVWISVTDDGPGVPAAELARIFEPFYRVDRSRSRDTGGSGLGLAIVRSAIETCGGEAIASLPEAGGLRVTLQLPRPAPDPAA
jgi:two-component system sensor histidine kinase CpxA